MKYLIFLTLLSCSKSFSALEAERVHAVVGHNAELPCNVTAETEGDQLNVLAWYRDGSGTAFYSRDLRNTDQPPAPLGGRYRLEADEDEGVDKLIIRHVQPEDAGAYQCLADFGESPSHKTDVELVVIEPPVQLWVIHGNDTLSSTSSSIGPYYIGDTIQLMCVAFGGKPKASLSWWLEKQPLESKVITLSEQRVRNDVTYGPLSREDHGRVLTCFAKNNEITQPLTIDITIDMYLPPELISVRGSEASGRVSAGDKLSVQCRVLGARPPPPIEWRLGDSNLVNFTKRKDTTESSQRLVVSEIEVVVEHEWDEMPVTCCVRAYRRPSDDVAEESTCAQGLPLTVFYPPALKITVEGELDNRTLTVIRGSDVSMNCTYRANPAIYQLIWFHEDDIIPLDDVNTESIIHPVLDLKAVSEKDAGEYVCSATNDEGSTYSQSIYIQIYDSAKCVEDSLAEYGLRENESVNMTCNVEAKPEPFKYAWYIINDAVDLSAYQNIPVNVIETEDSTFLYTRSSNTSNSTIFCWGVNEVDASPPIPCTFLVTDKTVPRPPTGCVALQTVHNDITVTCDAGHDGGLPQKFKIVVTTDTEEIIETETKTEPKFKIQDPSQNNYKLKIVAFNEKGESKVVELGKDSVVLLPESRNVVTNITTLSLALFGGVLLVALAACGLVLCASDRGSRTDLPRVTDPPLCAYNTEESNCETFNDSDDSEFNIRRTDSFRKAMARYPSKNFDVRRTSSFHSTRYMNEAADPEPVHKCGDVIRHSATCRVHSLQNINRRRDMDNLCDHLVMHLPPDVNYVPMTTNTFHTMPKKMRHKLSKELSDEASVITQTSDGFSLPPPPDEFGTYRAASRIKDVPKPAPTYTTIARKNSAKKSTSKQQQQYSSEIISPMNTVGLPTISGGQSSVYSYPDDDGRQVNTNPFEDSS